jgi:hypothetical protein
MTPKRISERDRTRAIRNRFFKWWNLTMGDNLPTQFALHSYIAGWEAATRRAKRQSK